MATTPQTRPRSAGHQQACLALLLGLCTVSGAHAGPAYSAPQAVARPGWASTQLWDINDTRQMVGQSSSDIAFEGFVVANGVYTLVAPAGATSSGATGISDSGVIVGQYTLGDPSISAPRSFILDNGVYSDFDLPGSTDVNLRRISANGRYLSGTVSQAGALVGFVYDRQTAQLARIGPLGLGVLVQGISSQGLAVGSTLGSNSFSFSFDLGTQTLTPYAGTDLGARPRFRDINDSGLITGWSGVSAFVGRAGDWTFFDPAPGMDVALAYGLNNRGDMVGFYVDPDGFTHSFLSSPVPEPAAWALLAGGLALLAWRRRPA